jgi:hypothetical protein
MPPDSFSTSTTLRKIRCRPSGKQSRCTPLRHPVKYMRPEVALLNSGVLLDVLGVGFDQFPVEVREEIVAKYPRINFKEGFIQEYFAGFAHKPATTCGTVNASVCERFIPGFTSPNACDLIAASPFPDSSSQGPTS